MNTITIIAAIAKNNALGKDNDLIWHLPADLKRFKKVTSGHHILMGRNTYESIGKILPQRRNVILSRDKNYKVENPFSDGKLVPHEQIRISNLLTSRPKYETLFLG